MRLTARNADSRCRVGRRAKGSRPLQKSDSEAPWRRVCLSPTLHSIPHTYTPHGASLPGTLPGLVMKVLHPKKLFRPRQPGPFDDPAITGLWFFSLPWSEGRLPAPAGPGGRRLWPSLWRPVSPAWQATSPYHPPGPRTPFQSHFPLCSPGEHSQKDRVKICRKDF